VSPIGRVEGSLDALGRALASPLASVGIVQMPGASYNATVEEDVLLGEPQHDACRVAALIRRVARQADDLEYEYRLGADRSLPGFRDDLAKDVHHARRVAEARGRSRRRRDRPPRQRGRGVLRERPAARGANRRGQRLRVRGGRRGARETAQLHDASMTVWQRNRGSRVIDYRVDAGGRFCAHA
jgi:hypothetical protein